MLTEKIRNYLKTHDAAGISEISHEIGEDSGVVEMALDILADKKIVIKKSFDCSSCSSNCNSKQKCSAFYSINRDTKNN